MTKSVLNLEQAVSEIGEQGDEGGGVDHGRGHSLSAAGRGERPAVFRITRRALVLSLSLGVLLAVGGCGGRGGIDGDVSAHVGAAVECEQAGLMLIAGEREEVFVCSNSATLAPVGCFAKVDGDVYDVTAQAEGALDCY